MSQLTPDRFAEFYKAVYGKEDDPNFGPFPWQERVAARACAGNWPRAVALPTAAGKTACIDIAVFALACRAPNAPRRIYYVVDRRLVVDQSWLHARDLAKTLKNSKPGILTDVANSLREISEATENEAPLEVYALRGGMYRETAWVRSPLQPTIIAATVDQVGSRLLFRGYGVSDSMKPVHAGLVGNDSLILLDEAHCSVPFDQTMQSIESYRRWNDNPSPFRYISITATPPADISDVERDNEEDRSHPVLGARIAAKKIATLVIAEKAKGKSGTSELVKVLEERARSLSSPDGCVGVIVNRVATARALKAVFDERGEDAVLLTGRMRPLDRDRLFRERLQPLLSNGSGAPPRFVIGTQCLEVGADFDFHALVTECASLDALRQRFGRVNRVAKRDTARAFVVIRGDDVEPKEKESDRDPIYDNSLPNTWKWLNEQRDGESEEKQSWIDVGAASIRAKMNQMTADQCAALNAPAPEAPALLPAHLDSWVQTSPMPVPDPDPAIFLHGTGERLPDVQVVFRADLGANHESLWPKIVGLCPPSSSEALPVRVGVFKEWLTGGTFVDTSGDVEGELEAIQNDEATIQRKVVDWRGPLKSTLIVDSRDVRPGGVYVVSIGTHEQRQDALMLGDFPFEVNDLGDEAFQRSRDRAVLRLTDSNLTDDTDNIDVELSDEISSLQNDVSPEWLTRAVANLKLPKSRRSEAYPTPLTGWVVTGKRRLHLELLDDLEGNGACEFLDDVESSYSPADKPILLEAHSRGVADYARQFADACKLEVETFALAGLRHDLGKLDPRFQRLLKGYDGGPAWAKSGKFSVADNAPRQYPRGARHELLSAAMVQCETNDDLLLHLIATHHGSARPFAGRVEENGTAQPPFVAELFGVQYKLPSYAQNVEQWNADLPERFWRVIRRFGWWGAAYREAVFRLADHARSREEEEQSCKSPSETIAKKWSSPGSSTASSLVPLPMSGLEGSNPLAFLAAIGTLVCLDRWSREDGRQPDWVAGPVALSWGIDGIPNVPVLHLAATPQERDFAEYVGGRLSRTVDEHPAAAVVRLLEDSQGTPSSIRRISYERPSEERPALDWLAALGCEVSPDMSSQLRTVRSDYMIGNLRSIMKRTMADHLYRAIFLPWDFADALDNQSMHWDPTEDRRHAYQWHMPSCDPTRKKSGGMLGANRLALEAWSLFPSILNGDRAATRGFRGRSSRDTYWTWPLWRNRLTVDSIASLMSLSELQRDPPRLEIAADYGVSTIYQCQRILVGKTPNLTQAVAVG
jgi:CRISPR-associated endonuclease/helicase Cas3